MCNAAVQALQLRYFGQGVVASLQPTVIIVPSSTSLCFSSPSVRSHRAADQLDELLRNFWDAEEESANQEHCRIPALAPRQRRRALACRGHRLHRNPPRPAWRVAATGSVGIRPVPCIHHALALRVSHDDSSAHALVLMKGWCSPWRR